MGQRACLVEDHRVRLGDRFKELAREVASEKTRSRAETYAAEALQWMIDYKHLKSVVSTATYVDSDKLQVHVECVAYNGDVIEFTRFVEVKQWP